MGHFYIFGFIARTLFWTYESWSRLQHALFYWYFLLCLNCYIRQKKTPLDSTQSRDQQLNQWTWPETPSGHKLIFYGITVLTKFSIL